jgi:hypothetical protein
MHSHIINIKSNSRGYFIAINIYDEETKKLIDYISDDILIANYLGLPVEKYKNVLISKFNAYVYMTSLYIKDKEDITRLSIWFKENMEQLIIANKLTKTN